MIVSREKLAWYTLLLGSKITYLFLIILIIYCGDSVWTAAAVHTSTSYQCVCVCVAQMGNLLITNTPIVRLIKATI